MHPRDLSIHDFTYALPEQRIAKEPLSERDASKLLIFRDGAITDHRFRELPDLIPTGSLLVLNDTRVVHARIGFKRATGAALECMVLTPEGGRRIEEALLDTAVSRWWCMMRNAKRWKGEELVLELDGLRLCAERIATDSGEHLIQFCWEGATFAEQLAHFGKVPLPPYMRRDAVAMDDARYNTVFAERQGSVAAPTASLHFSEGVMDGLAERRIDTTRLTLHVGAGTFLPVKSATMADHGMHAEQIRVQLSALQRLKTQLGQAPIVAVGTTALRTLESIYWQGVKVLGKIAGGAMSIEQWEPYGTEESELPTASVALQAVIDQLLGDQGSSELTEPALIGSTRLLVAPGYRFRMVDALVTNFHQPESTLLLLVAAFVGPGWRSIYDHALASDYRFLSYGDGSLLFRGGSSPH